MISFPDKRIINSEEETTELALELAKTLEPGNIVILNGNLGSGKTFFVKQTAKYFNITNVNSPTFSLINEYEGNLKIFHFDFYRINKAADLYDIGLNDYLNDNSALIFIEWGELFEEVLPQKRIEIRILLKKDFSREFYFEKKY